ncbi:METTL5 family protein [Natronolimnobius baerhuensis]|uniref:RNA methyltransferase n=1 Tax=Natronolimnobius baerhuensis TaxID=253108 RepID=A0A202EDH0_9EURY|nr:METTL5 family protein [Natronolimnobius baerhuensis]OVE86316.1 RNA methyltransferase [Natronolimnobius baerhuensis]
MSLSRRSLARELESVADFADPSPDLEQYLTPPEIAAHVCHLAALEGDCSRPVVDLGTGTGMLAIGAALAGAERVVGVDIDSDALATARKNATRVDAADIEWVRGDGTSPPLALENATVLSNPPFGAQRGNRHADRDFLEAAAEIGTVSYTIHNEGSQEFVESFAADEGGEVTHAFRAEFPIAHRFEFHSEAESTLQAEVFRIKW